MSWWTGIQHADKVLVWLSWYSGVGCIYMSWYSGLGSIYMSWHGGKGSSYSCCTWAGIGGVGSNPPDDPVKPPATALAGAANWTALDSSGIVPEQTTAMCISQFWNKNSCMQLECMHQVSEIVHFRYPETLASICILSTHNQIGVHSTTVYSDCHGYFFIKCYDEILTCCSDEGITTENTTEERHLLQWYI